MLSLFIAAALFPISPAEDVGKASRLYRQCQGAIRVFDLGSTASDDMENAGFCVGYIDGFTDGMTMHGPVKGICATNASVDAMLRVFVKWMNDNPRAMDYSREVAVVSALSGAYPCTKG